MKRRVTTRLLGVVLAAALVGLIATTGASTSVSATPNGTTVSTAAGVVAPEAGPLTAAPSESASAREARLLNHLEAREAAGRQVDNGPVVMTGRPTATGDVPEVGSPEAGEANAIGRNFLNTVARNVSSSLAEPATAKDGTEALYLGNSGYMSRSANSGLTWVQDVTPAGPAQAPFVCCDSDAVHHTGLDATFAVILYLNSGATRGVARIFVRRNTIAGGNDCTYLFDPGVNRLPDYPHIAVSNGFLYLAVANFDTKGTVSTGDDTWVNSQVRRFNASQMANCGLTSFNTFTYTASSQRTFVPVEGASNTMYWGAISKIPFFGDFFTIFRWPESSPSVTQTARSIGTTNFTNPDCKNAAGFDWIERSSAWDIRGYRLRGAIGGTGTSGSAVRRLTFMWNAASDGSHAQAHVHSAVFREFDLALIAQPHIFNQTFCFGFPVVASNSQGDLGVTIGAGGDKTAGSGTSAHGDIIVEDESSPGITFGGLSATVTASATFNRSDGRFGDYFTIRRNELCPLSWVATNYGLNAGAAFLPSKVNARYIEFRSGFDPVCP
jgi:hypothetical protein